MKKGNRKMKKYQVRVCYDKLYETLKEFQFDDENAANSFFDKAVKRAEIIGFGRVAIFRNNFWLIKSAHVG